MNPVLYLHGFSSAGASAKAQQLRHLLAPTALISPTYPSHDPLTALPQLDAQLRETFPNGAARIIGSSLGGYYAQHLAAQRRDARIVLINPALQPALLERAIGANTNLVSGESFEFTRDQLAALMRMDVDAAALPGRCLVLLDAGDEVIDYRYAAAKYRTHGRVHVFDGGSHRFEHLLESLDFIREFLDV